MSSLSLSLLSPFRISPSLCALERALHILSTIATSRHHTRTHTHTKHTKHTTAHRTPHHTRTDWWTASLGRSDTHGSIEKGKRGDLVLLQAPQWEHVVYELVDPPLLHVVKGGRVAYTNPALVRE